MQDVANRGDILKLLMFESSAASKELVTLKEYVSTLPEGSKEIYLFIAQNREAAMHSAYMEPFIKQNIPVLLSYNRMDELLLPFLNEYEGLKIVRIEDARLSKTEADSDAALPMESFILSVLGQQVASAKRATRSFGMPFLIVDHTANTLSMRYLADFLRDEAKAEQESPSPMPASMPPVTIEFNPDHPVLKGAMNVKESQPEVADLLLKQAFDMALMEAGLMEKVHPVVKRMDAMMNMLVQKMM